MFCCLALYRARFRMSFLNLITVCSLAIVSISVIFSANVIIFLENKKTPGGNRESVVKKGLLIAQLEDYGGVGTQDKGLFLHEAVAQEGDGLGH